MDKEKVSNADESTVEPVESKIKENVEELVANIDEKIELPAQLQPIFAYMDIYPWMKALVALLLFLAIAKIFTWVVSNLIRRIAVRTNTRVDESFAVNLQRPLFWSLALLGFLVAASLVGITEKTNDVLTSLTLSVLIFLWMRFALKMAKALLAMASRNASDHSIVRPQTLPLFTNLTYLGIIVFALYFIFQVWNIDMTAWLASAGIAGIAIGFAAKDTLANLFSGVFIMADSPYKIGDYVVLDDGTTGLRGKVTHIGIRSTRVLTRDDVEVTIPNSIMGNSKVINESGGPNTRSRIRVAVGVAYGSDIDKVKAVLQSVADESPDVCKHPEPRVRFRSFGPSSLNFELLCWIEHPELRGRVLDSLNSIVYKKFISEAIEIPFSKQDLYIKELPEAGKLSADFHQQQS